MPKEYLRDIVVLLPGAMGSVLQKDGRDIWPPVSGLAGLQNIKNWGPSSQYLFLGKDDPDADDLEDGIRATRLISNFHIFPGWVKFYNGYSDIARLITDIFEVRQGSIQDKRPANFFEFPYDWRRDSRVAARQLEKIIDEKLHLWRVYSGEKDAKVIFLAHSMGGLVARHYLEVRDRWQDCRALITFGTPYRGSLKAVSFLANGYKLLSVDLIEHIRSFTSSYQLLPIYKAVKTSGGYKRVAEMDGISVVERRRAEEALAFHREIQDAVTRHRKDEEYCESGYKILPVVGICQPTVQSAELVDGRLVVSYQLPEGIDQRLEDGDGTVPMLSAIPIELSNRYEEKFVPERHASLQRNQTVLSFVGDRLKRMQIEKWDKIWGPGTKPEIMGYSAISLDLDDLYSVEEPIELRARLLNVSKSAGALQARIEAIERNGEGALKREFHESGGEWVLRMEGVPPGLYSLTVYASQAAVPAVHDLFAVVG